MNHFASAFQVSARLRTTLTLAVVVLSSGCAQLKVGAPVASIDNIQKAKTAIVKPVATGTFAATGTAKDVDAGVSVRTNTVSVEGGSFASYLKQTLETELKGAGLYDDKANTEIEGTIIGNKLNVPVGTGSGELAVKFGVTRAGAKVYDKTLTESHQWEASFVGAVAIPASMNEYSALYRKMVGRLLADPEFSKAVNGK